MLANSGLSHRINSPGASTCCTKCLITTEELNIDCRATSSSARSVGKQLGTSSAAGLISLQRRWVVYPPFFAVFWPSEIDIYCYTTPFPSDATKILGEKRVMFNAGGRASFPAECLCAGSMPTRWNVVPIKEQSLEGSWASVENIVVSSGRPPTMIDCWLRCASQTF